MAFEPINIFSHRIDPAGVVNLLRTLAPAAIVNGPDDDWSTIEIVTAKSGLVRREKKLTLGHDAEHYDGDDWATQIMGMQGYFSEFPDTVNKQDIMRLIRSFRNTPQLERRLSVVPMEWFAESRSPSLRSSTLLPSSSSK